MRLATLTASIFAITVGALTVPLQAQPLPLTEQLQQITDSFLAQHAQIEQITGIEMQVSLGDAGPVIAVSSGNDGLRDAQPLTTSTLFEIGSNTKSFTSALILMLEAQGKLNIHQTLGDWLPEYPAWKSVTIQSLLNMTSGIPSYDSTPAMTMLQVDPNYQFTPQQLIAFVDPNQGSTIGATSGYNYSNTNYFLAGLIIERASGLTYRQALEQWIIKPLHLRNTYYKYGAIPGYILDRMPAGFYTDTGCERYQPDYGQAGCVSALQPLVGKDVRAENLSWAGPAGGIISTLGDLTIWYRALFEGRVLPPAQLEEMQSQVSQTTGLPIAGVSASDPAGYGLALVQEYSQQLFGGAVWAYEGETLAMRVVFAYWPQYNLVITMSANSNVSDTEDPHFPEIVLSSTLSALLSTGTIQDNGASPTE